MTQEIDPRQDETYIRRTIDALKQMKEDWKGDDSPEITQESLDWIAENLQENFSKRFPVISLSRDGVVTCQWVIGDLDFSLMIEPNTRLGVWHSKRKPDDQTEETHTFDLTDKNNWTFLDRHLGHHEWLKRCSEGDDPYISTETYDVSRKVWWSFWQESRHRLSVPAACTHEDKLMFYAWDTKTKHLEVEILPGEPLQVFSKNRLTEKTSFEEYDHTDPIPETVREMIADFCKND